MNQDGCFPEFSENEPGTERGRGDSEVFYPPRVSILKNLGLGPFGPKPG